MAAWHTFVHAPACAREAQHVLHCQVSTNQHKKLIIQIPELKPAFFLLHEAN